MKHFALSIVVLLVAASIASAQAWNFVDTAAKKQYDASGILPNVAPAKVTGSIVISGSSTVYPLATKVLEQFKKEGFKGDASIDGPGTGAGATRLADKACDLANGSSKYKPAQIEALTKKGMTHLEFQVATDALTVVVNKKNTWLSNATEDDLKKIFTAEKWSDVNPAWPDQKILRFIPGTDSGTHVYFLEHVFKITDTKKQGNPLVSAPGVQLSENDDVLVQGVEKNVNAIGFFGFSYYLNEKARMNAVNIRGITPSVETVNAGKYPLARPLFVNTTVEILNEKPQAAAFMMYTLTFADEIIKKNSKLGFFPAPAEKLAAGKKALANAIAKHIKK